MICVAVAMTAAVQGFGQVGPTSSNAAPRKNQEAPAYVPTDSDRTLEIAPRVPPPPMANEPPPSTPDDESAAPASNSDSAENPAVPTEGVPAAESNSAAMEGGEQKLPYLGISAQYIVSKSKAGRAVAGLEIVSIDANSPAERAGLLGHGAATKLGATGATAGALMAPLDLVVIPLLKKSGQLGQGGDLIVAIDDKRIASEIDLQVELATLKPGDTIYLTVVRPFQDGSQRTLKIPVILGNTDLSIANAGAARTSSAAASPSNAPAAPATPAQR
jgi:PDZ domain-containing protein